VIGSERGASKKALRVAEEVGKRIAKKGAVLICGGLGGVMEAACKGAKSANGITVGVLPYSKELVNPYVDIKIVTEMSDGRNVINVKSGDVVIVIAGRFGTLSEVGLALSAGKKVIAIKGTGGVADLLAEKVLNGNKILVANSVDEAIELAFSQ
jgi:hypothetical protein